MHGYYVIVSTNKVELTNVSNVFANLGWVLGIIKRVDFVIIAKNVGIEIAGDGTDQRHFVTLISDQDRNRGTTRTSD